MALKWTDTAEIAAQLYEQDGDLDPLAVRFTDLHQRVLALAEFDDDPGGSKEKILEAIQMAWYEEWQADHGRSPLDQG